MLLTANRSALFGRWHEIVAADSVVVARIEEHRSAARIVTDADYRVAVRGILRPHVSLTAEDHGAPLAAAHLSGFLGRVMTIALAGDATIVLRPRHVLRRPYDVVHGGDVAGSIVPRGITARWTTIELARPLPPALVAFLYWLAWWRWRLGALQHVAASRS